MHFFRAEGLEVAPQPLFWCPKSSDAPVSVNINGTDYYYVKNLQGDIIALLDRQGSCVVKYTYDAWGKVLSVEDSTETNIGTINPLRYRGYYYDSDLGFYYLRSRYYDPTVGRFLNADDIAYLGANGTVISHNLFAYCENNAVNNVDYTGYWWFSISVGVAGVIFDAVITWVLPYIFTAFKATKLLKWAKFSRWFRNKYNSATKSLARAIYNGMDSIMYNIMGKAANAATRAFTLSKIQRWVENILSFSIGYGIAWIIDRFDGDGKSGYIRF